jgi:RNAse (barnase) inhibitor barstar
MRDIQSMNLHHEFLNVDLNEDQIAELDALFDVSTIKGLRYPELLMKELEE